VESRGSVRILSLNRGVTNALNTNLINQISENLNTIRDDPNVKGIVLSSSNEKFFAIGFDIPSLFPLNMEEFADFYNSFNELCLELYTFPKPVIAAITGHATAGGCILTLCCDYRFIAEGRKLMGLNEIKLGVPVPYVADCILRQLVGYKIAREITDFGDFYPPEKLLQLGLVDEIIPMKELIQKSIETIKLAGSSTEAFRLIKNNRVEIVESHIRRYLKERQSDFINLWYSPTCRKLLQEAVKKF
jgi:enoyl-CoA hydratase/carnithine racemase